VQSPQQILDELAAAIEVKTQTIEDEKLRMDQAQTECQLLSRAATELQMAHDQNSTLKTQVRRLVRKIEIQDTNAAANKRKYDELDDRLEYCTEMLAAKEEDVERLNQDINVLKRKAELQDSELVSTKCKVTSLQQQNESYCALRQQHISVRTQLMRERDKGRKELQIRKLAYEALRRDNAKLQIRIDQYQAMRKDISKALSEAT
jgi:chromosome segregation ATPase